MQVDERYIIYRRTKVLVLYTFILKQGKGEVSLLSVAPFFRSIKESSSWILLRAFVIEATSSSDQIFHHLVMADIEVVSVLEDSQAPPSPSSLWSQAPAYFAQTPKDPSDDRYDGQQMIA